MSVVICMSFTFLSAPISSNQLDYSFERLETGFGHGFHFLAIIQISLQRVLVVLKCLGSLFSVGTPEAVHNGDESKSNGAFNSEFVRDEEDNSCEHGNKSTVVASVGCGWS